MLAGAGDFPGESVAARRASPESEPPPASIKHNVETTIDKCEGYLGMVNGLVQVMARQTGCRTFR
jgi:hypothetical protein